MKKIGVWTKVKSIIALLLWTIYLIANNYFLPIISSRIALIQMQNSNEGYAMWRLYQGFNEHGFTILILITLLIFFKEIKKLVTSPIEK